MFSCFAIFSSKPIKKFANIKKFLIYELEIEQILLLHKLTVVFCVHYCTSCNNVQNKVWKKQCRSIKCYKWYVFHLLSFILTRTILLLLTLWQCLSKIYQKIWTTPIHSGMQLESFAQTFIFRNCSIDLYVSSFNLFFENFFLCQRIWMMKKHCTCRKGFGRLAISCILVVTKQKGSHPIFPIFFFSICPTPIPRLHVKIKALIIKSWK